MRRLYVMPSIARYLGPRLSGFHHNLRVGFEQWPFGRSVVWREVLRWSSWDAGRTRIGELK